MTLTSFAGRAVIATAAVLLATATLGDAASAKPRKSERTSINIDVSHAPTIKHDSKKNKLVVRHNHTIKYGKTTIVSSRKSGYSLDCNALKLGKWLDCGAASDLF